MEEPFDSFNAPQFVDFSKAPDYLNETVDTYFDIDHENEPKERKDISKNSENNTFDSPIETIPDSTVNYNNGVDPLEKSFDQPSDEPAIYNKRKSMSVGNLVLFNEEEFTPYLEDIGENIKNLNINHNGEVKTEIPSHKNNKVPLRSSGSSTLRKKGSQDHLNKLAQPKRYASVENLKDGNNGKFVSLAEAINKFQNRTPTRFRSKPNLAQNHQPQTLCRTVPESPALQTKARSRPVRILSQEEREKIEFENHQKFKIKANPINKKIFHGPIKPTVPVQKKASTIPQPFNLTSAPPKQVMPSPQKYEFHAKPMPRSVEKPKKTLEIERLPNTKPITPTFMKNYKMPNHKAEEKLTKDDGATRDNVRPKLTRPIPFSFEHRDKMIQNKREQLINKIREEERKAREFHAKPVPKSLYRSGSIRSDSESSRNSSRKRNSTENLFVQFKARPAVVLYKEPFVPVKTGKPLTELEPFELNSELRAHEREEFKRKKHEKEEQLELLRKLDEEETLRQEQEEIARLRKETQYKAKPIKKYKGVNIQPSGKITVPISPNFQTDLLRRKKNKENIPNNSNTSF